MMNAEPDTQPADAAAPRGNWNGALIWSILGLIGWVAFEQTAQPAVGTAVFCSRLGWNDILTAFWVRRIDPHRARGSACFWFCLSLGMLRIVVAAAGMAMFVIMLQIMLQQAGPNPNAGGDPPAGFIGLAVLMLATAPLLTLFALLGYAAARRGGILIWIDRSLAQARRDSVWPPDYPLVPVNSTDNRVRLAWASALITMASLGLALPIVVAIFAGLPAGAIVLAAETPLVLLVLRPVTAPHPADCWSVADENVWLEDSHDSADYENA